jgi:hypothetical protein
LIPACKTPMKRRLLSETEKYSIPNDYFSTANHSSLPPRGELHVSILIRARDAKHLLSRNRTRLADPLFHHLRSPRRADREVRGRRFCLNYRRFQLLLHCQHLRRGVLARATDEYAEEEPIDLDWLFFRLHCNGREKPEQTKRDSHSFIRGTRRESGRCVKALFYRKHET